MSPESLTVRTLDGGVVDLDLNALEAIPDKARIFPDDDAFDEATLIWNGLIQKEPALVLQPETTNEVAAAVDLARDHDLLFSIKGGGHNIAGLALADGGVTLDMSRFKDVRVDIDRGVVHAGAGSLLGDVDRASQQHGLATTLGFVSQTGLAGLTLGGGFGYLTRRFGFTVDELVEVEMVTADGQVRRPSRDTEPDLFWAIRGGGGNFGVVTEFTYQLHEVGPDIVGGLIAWPAQDHAEDVLGIYQEVTAAAPRELTLVLTMRLAPPAPFIPETWHGKPIIGIVACHSGDPEQADQDLAPIKELGHPIADLVIPKTYVEQQSMLDATQPKGANYYWKTEFLSELPDHFLTAFADIASGIESPMSQMMMFHLEGALNEYAEDDAAVGNRDATYVTGAAGAWPAGSPSGEVHEAWVRDSWEKIKPFSTGGNYINFQTVDDDLERIESSYRANYERLQRVKAEYDPGNLFRVNRNLAPAE